MQTTTTSGADWMASGGAYTLLILQTVIAAIVGIGVALWIGRKSQAEGDGCLLAIANLILALVGAGIGYFSTPYPHFVLTALIGSLALPAIATAFFATRIRK